MCDMRAADDSRRASAFAVLCCFFYGGSTTARQAGDDPIGALPPLATRLPRQIDMLMLRGRIGTVSGGGFSIEDRIQSIARSQMPCAMSLIPPVLVNRAQALDYR